ncbi:helix-turn-helix domain-containing protein [Streptomyces sp. NRRL F-5053]|uniref:helix-turn-helix domain-containing protein n=1 Tax=Streptomyces sp. NRRL F-5053 TaxID=1463854 RepID=UPI0004CA3C5B|nr:helix-turn-helix transcriptional regulator [Streptomyces sp. NRRL F-5053]
MDQHVLSGVGEKVTLGVAHVILRRYRDGQNPEDLGLSPREVRPGPRVSGLTQDEVDELMDRAGHSKGRGTYRKVETGNMRPSREYLRGIAEVLQFTEDDYTFAHLDLFGEEPAEPLNPDAGLVIHPFWERVVTSTAEMAYVNDRRYDVRYYNKAFADMFPSGKPPENTMEWMILDEEARGPDGCLQDWDTVWGPLVISQLFAALAAHRHDQVLNRIHDRILADKRARRLLDRQGTYVSPDGDRRPLRHAKLGDGTATINASAPLDSPGARFMVILFDPA